ncbi:hypothetical protein [Aureimonas glaciei]|uniref:TIGR02588 family protein n=1 Tax=Aureimonas glaciei TaxID=1776957 RepID=A0A917DHJ4_9HYPH|nr:hypothetical protein [Aureimonas glaciei]GGD38176.1 TIGR02588 family protein [Aureimonas glaciei]
MGKPLTEWICAGLGAIIAIGTFTVVALELPGEEADVPDVRLMVTGVEPTSGGYLVRIRARNLSGATATALEVEGTLKRGSETIETSRVTFDYVPRDSDESGGLWFRQDPRLYEVSVRATGYQDP